MALAKKCRHLRDEWRTCGCAWYADIRVDGKRRYVNLGSDRAAAGREYRALTLRLETGGLDAPTGTDPTFTAVADRWERITEQRVAPSTMRGYKSALALAKAWLGDTDVRAITAATIAEMETDLTRSGQSLTYVRHVRRATRSVLGLAVDDGTIADVPDMRRHRIVQRNREARYFTPADMTRVLASLIEPYAAMTEFAFLTGLRPGEVIGLEGGDNNGDTVTVQRTVHSSMGTVGPTKSRRSRIVDLSTRARALLRPADGGERVFGPSYTPWLRYFQDAIARAGLPPAGLHALRHSNVALRIAAGQDMVYIADQLGHSTAAFTLRAYGHLLRRPESQAAKLDEAVRQLGGLS